LERALGRDKRGGMSRVRERGKRRDGQGQRPLGKGRWVWRREFLWEFV